MSRCQRLGQLIKWVVVAGAPTLAIGVGAQDATPAMPVSELRVVAPPIKQLHLPPKPRWFMLANLTATFECDPPVKNGMNLGGCGGMRTRDKTVDEVLQRITLKMPGVGSELAADLKSKNLSPSRIEQPLPL